MVKKVTIDDLVQKQKSIKVAIDRTNRNIDSAYLLNHKKNIKKYELAKYKLIKNYYKIEQAIIKEQDVDDLYEEMSMWGW